MFGTIELPIWFVVIAVVFAAIAALERALPPPLCTGFPGAGWSQCSLVERVFRSPD